jgi:O-antigen/teichoic acid export membrane protein
VTADVVVQVVSVVGNAAIGVVVTAILARQLGTVGFGEWSTIFSVVGITGYLANLKMQEVTVREIARAPESESEWLGALISLQALIVVPVAVVTAGVLLIISRNGEMRLAGVIIAASEVAMILSMTGAAFRLRVRNDLAMAVLTFNSLIWGAAVAIVAAAGGAIAAFAAAFTLCTLASGTLTALLARRRASFRLRGSHRQWRALASASFILGLAGLLSLAHAQIDQLLVYELAPHPADAGLYGALNRVLIRAMAVPDAVMTTLFPLIASAVVDDMNRARRLVQTALEYLAMVSLPAFGFTLVAAEPLLRLLYGPSFVSAAGTFPVVMGSFVVSCWGVVSASMVIILGLQRRFVTYVLLGLLLNVGLNLALVPTRGYRAAAWVTVFTETVVIGLSLRAVLGEIQMRIRVARLIRVAAVSAAITVLLFGLRSVDVGLAGLIVAAVVAYPALLIISRTLDRGELQTLLTERSR